MGSFRRICGGVPANYVALYDMNRVTPERGRKFLDKVRRVMMRL